MVPHARLRDLLRPELRLEGERENRYLFSISLRPCLTGEIQRAAA
jgi:hypothetical protein